MLSSEIFAPLAGASVGANRIFVNSLKLQQKCKMYQQVTYRSHLNGQSYSYLLIIRRNFIERYRLSTEIFSAGGCFCIRPANIGKF
jgi:hypothetical protein